MVKVYGSFGEAKGTKQKGGERILWAMRMLGASAVLIAVATVTRVSFGRLTLLDAPPGHPTRPPMMDHVTLGVGNEQAVDDAANWALIHLGKTKGTMIEAMIANGTISSPEEALGADMIKEVDQASKEQTLGVVMPTHIDPAEFKAAEPAEDGEEPAAEEPAAEEPAAEEPAAEEPAAAAAAEPVAAEAAETAATAVTQEEPASSRRLLAMPKKTAKGEKKDKARVGHEGRREKMGSVDKGLKAAKKGAKDGKIRDPRRELGHGKSEKM